MVGIPGLLLAASALGQDNGVKLPERKAGESDGEYLKRIQDSVAAFNAMAQEQAAQKDDDAHLQRFQMTRTQPPANPPRFAFTNPEADIAHPAKVTDEKKRNALFAKIRAAGHQPNFTAGPIDLYTYDDGTFLAKYARQNGSAYFSSYYLYGDIDHDGKVDETHVDEHYKDQNNAYRIRSGATRQFTAHDSETDPKKRYQNRTLGFLSDVDIDVTRKHYFKVSFADRRKSNDVNNSETGLRLCECADDTEVTYPPGKRDLGRESFTLSTIRNYDTMSGAAASQRLRTQLTPVPNPTVKPPKVFR